ncbi:MAG: cystathionine gamma-lyase [Sciscionella sp.]
MDVSREMRQHWGDGTRCVHAGEQDPLPGTAFLPGPTMATGYHLGVADANQSSMDYYGGASNPTWRALEAAIGELDGGECVLFASGMAALSTVLRTVLEVGDTLVLPADGYYLLRRHVVDELGGLRLDVREVPTGGLWSVDLVSEARLVLLETPSNPGLDVCDIAEVAELCAASGALLAVDNTTATPLGQRPLELGAHLTIASDTKALAGHSDVVLGHVSTVDSTLATRLRTARRGGGAIPGPFETWLAHRGLGTLDLRLSRQAANAAALVEALRGHPAVRGVRWPGADGDPTHPVAARQMCRFGGVLCFELPSAAAVEEFIRRSRVVSSATSFGGLHSTVDRRAQWGDPVPEGFVRFSSGIEDTADLVADVLAALG